MHDLLLVSILVLFFHFASRSCTHCICTEIIYCKIKVSWWWCQQIHKFQLHFFAKLILTKFPRWQIWDLGSGGQVCLVREYIGGDFDQRTGKGVSLLSLLPTLCEIWNNLPSLYSSYADAASVLQSCQFSFAVKPKTQRLESVLNHWIPAYQVFARHHVDRLDLGWTGM